MKHTLLVLTLGVLSFPIAAQNTLSLLGGDEPAPRSGGESIMESDKYKIAYGIYKRLVEARGDFRYQEPRFIMSRTPKEGASMNYDSLEILLEEKAYNVCAKFGDQRDAALAIVLSHELMHYYEKHGWRREFSKSYKNLDIGIKLGGVVDDVTNETQADYLGGFLAYSAGFGLFDKSPELIQNLYNEYKLPDTLPKYASLEDRKKLSSATISKLELLVDAFEVGNLLTAIGKNAEARQYYQYVLREYQSREIFNNVGVTALREVMKEDGGKFFYPVELDLKSRAGRGDGWGSSTKRKELLLLAIKNFDAAINMDPTYAPAFLNKACAYTMLADLTRAQYYAEIEAKELAKKNKLVKTESDANILLGIIAYMKNDSIKARQLFEAESKTNPLADKNLRILLRLPDEETETPAFALSAKLENIDSISLASFSVNPLSDKGKTQKIDEKTFLFQYQVPKKASKIYFTQQEVTPDEYITHFFHLTQPGYKGKTGKVAVGASRQEITDAYKAPVRTVETPIGEILVYKRAIFILEGGKLVRWGIYQMP
jgi:hypothetical protein